MVSTNVVQVTFPSTYQSAYTNLPIGITSSVTCLSSLGISGVFCKANSSNANVVTAYNLFTSNGSAFSTSFQINNILVPATVQPVDTITLATYTSAGVGYDTCTVSYSNLNPLVMNSLALVSNGTIFVNQILPINITLPLLANLHFQDYILISMPTSYSPAYRLQGLVGLTGTTTVGCIVNSNTSSSLNFSIASSINVISAGSIFYIFLSNIIAPPSTGFTPIFTVSIYQNGFLKSTGSLSIDVYPNAITAIRTTANNPVIGSFSSYSINFVMIDAIPSSGMFRVLLPASIVADNSVSQVTVNSNAVSFSLLNSLNGL